MRWILLAPGPSMSQEVADSVRGERVGIVSSAYQLAPWANFLAATDAMWWRKNPKAKQFEGKKFSPCNIGGEVVSVKTPIVTTSTNSGVLALECAKRLGATEIYLLGFDMHGSHYFGPYTNGLRNTVPRRREVHHQQYGLWATANKELKVYNCTEGSALLAFPMAKLGDLLDG